MVIVKKAMSSVFSPKLMVVVAFLTILLLHFPTPSSAHLSSGITCVVSFDSVFSGIGVRVKTQISPPVSDGLTILQSSLDGQTWIDIVSDSPMDGTFFYRWNPHETGLNRVRAVWTGDSQYSGSVCDPQTLEVKELPFPPPPLPPPPSPFPEIVLALDDRWYTPESTVRVTGIFSIFEDRLPNASVSLTLTATRSEDQFSLSSMSRTADSGIFVANFSLPEDIFSGNYNVQAEINQTVRYDSLTDTGPFRANASFSVQRIDMPPDPRQEEIQRLFDQLSMLEESLSQASSRILILEEELVESVEKALMLERQIGELEDERNKLVEEIISLEEQLSELTIRNSDLEKMLASQNASPSPEQSDSEFAGVIETRLERSQILVYVLTATTVGLSILVVLLLRKRR